MVIAIFKGEGVNNAGLQAFSVEDQKDRMVLRFQNRTYQTMNEWRHANVYGFFVLSRSAKAVVVEEDVANVIGGAAGVETACPTAAAGHWRSDRQSQAEDGRCGSEREAETEAGRRWFSERPRLAGSRRLRPGQGLHPPRNRAAEGHLHQALRRRRALGVFRVSPQHGREHEEGSRRERRIARRAKVDRQSLCRAPPQQGRPSVVWLRRFRLSGRDVRGCRPFLHGGGHVLNRTLVIKDRDGRWYVHPLPSVSPLLSGAER